MGILWGLGLLLMWLGFGTTPMKEDETLIEVVELRSSFLGSGLLTARKLYLQRSKKKLARISRLAGRKTVTSVYCFSLAFDGNIEFRGHPKGRMYHPSPPASAGRKLESNAFDCGGRIY